jgi:hypothetical protein
MMQDLDVSASGGDGFDGVPIDPAVGVKAVHLFQVAVEFGGSALDAMLRQGHAQAAECASDITEQFAAAADRLGGPARVALKVVSF